MIQTRHAAHQRMRHQLVWGYDFWLISVSLIILGLGLVMMTSASVSIAAKEFNDPLYYFWRQMVATIIGLSLAAISLKIAVRFWQYVSVPLLIFSTALLLLILVPGVGKEVNGSTRWIQLGSFAIQVSEFVKFCIIAYLAGYIVRHRIALQTEFFGFIRPVAVLTLISGLLLLEPDFGASVVLFIVALGMLFMGGVPLSRFFAWGCVAFSALVTLAVLSPYRMQRLMSFIDPWRDPYDSGFQLSQALIAFGRGEWLGIGLGNGIQKLFYLPEAHTDFIFAVFAEELGLVGSVVLILLYSFIVWRSFMIGHIAECAEKYFAAYFAYGIGLIIGVQVYINLGVNMGILPTKGLTLPLMSYGGNSLIVYCVLLGVLLRIEYENRAQTQPFSSNTVKKYA